MAELTRKYLLDLEHRGWDALCESRGGSFYGEMMSADAVMILVNGMVLDRPGVIASLNEAPPWSSYTITDAQLVPVGIDSAAMVYRATAHRDGQQEPFAALMASVYRLTEGQIRLALYQQTTITH